MKAVFGFYRTYSIFSYSKELVLTLIPTIKLKFYNSVIKILYIDIIIEWLVFKIVLTIIHYQK